MFSGPQPGEAITTFRVLQIIDPDTSKNVQIKPQETKTTFLVFLHEVTEPAMVLMMTLDWYASQQKVLDRHYVLLNDDKSKAEQRAKRWSSRSLFTNSQWCVSLDGIEGPGRYGLNRHAVMTLIVAKNNVVVGNFALTQPNNTDAPEILAALANALGKPKPSYEKVRAELAAHRELQRKQRTAQNPVFKIAPSPEPGRLMLAMIYRENINETDVQKASLKLTGWAGDDKQKNAALVKYCKTLLKGNFEINRYSREGLRKLVGEE